METKVASTVKRALQVAAVAVEAAVMSSGGTLVNIKTRSANELEPGWTEALEWAWGILAWSSVVAGCCRTLINVLAACAVTHEAIWAPTLKWARWIGACAKAARRVTD